jgi:hypothetical protein
MRRPAATSLSPTIESAGAALITDTNACACASPPSSSTISGFTARSVGDDPPSR